MVEISVDGGTIKVDVLGWSKIWCLKSRLAAPLRCVRGVRADGPLPRRFWIRLPGTQIPGVIKAGSYCNGSQWSFWDVRRRRDDVVVIELQGWKYDYLVVEVKNPAATVAVIRNALSLHSSGNLSRSF